MCPVSLDVSCGALPFPAGLGGGWLGVLSRGTLGSWCCCEIPGRSLGGVESDLPVPSERQTLAPEI